jgi:branched-chain amino acid transport system substrate-binding protein
LEAHVTWIAWLCAAVIAFAAPASAEILIGAAGPLNGQYAALGNQLRIGAEAAVADANAAGGINGESLSVVALDDGCDTRKAVEVARQFVARDIRLVVGHYCSGTSAAAALVYKQAGILMITPSASQPALTDAGNWNVFRMTGRDDMPYLLAAKRIAAAPGKPKAAVISTAAPPFQDLARKLIAMLPGAQSLDVKLGAFNATQTAQQIVSNLVQRVVVLLPPSESAALSASLLYAGFQGEVYGSEQFFNDDFAANSGEIGFPVLALFPEDPLGNPAATAVAGRLAAEGIEAEGAVLPAYASVQVFLAAARARSVNDGPAMSAWIRSGTGVDTVLGRISFDAKGDLARQPFTWYRWLGAARRFVPE